MVVSKAERLINRFPVSDLALALSFKGQKRQRFLRNFVESQVIKSYRALRETAPQIYNVRQPLFPELEPPSWSDIERKIRRIAGARNADANLAAAHELRFLLSQREFQAYPHPPQSIHIAPGRRIQIGIDFYLVEGDEVIFQFLQPRLDDRMKHQVSRTLMSLIHYAYVFGDFEAARVEIANLSAPAPGADREPRFERLTPTELPSRNELNGEIEDVHEVLQWLAR